MLKHILEGLRIIGQYASNVQAEHDQIWAGEDDMPLTAEEIETLAACGWEIADEGGWTFTL